MHTVIEPWRMRSSSAHCDRTFAVEDRRDSFGKFTQANLLSIKPYYSYLFPINQQS